MTVVLSIKDMYNTCIIFGTEVSLYTVPGELSKKHTLWFYNSFKYDID